MMSLATVSTIFLPHFFHLTTQLKTKINSRKKEANFIRLHLCPIISPWEIVKRTLSFIFIILFKFQSPKLIIFFVKDSIEDFNNLFIFIYNNKTTAFKCKPTEAEVAQFHLHPKFQNYDASNISPKKYQNTRGEKTHHISTTIRWQTISFRVDVFWLGLFL